MANITINTRMSQAQIDVIERFNETEVGDIPSLSLQQYMDLVLDYYASVNDYAGNEINYAYITDQLTDYGWRIDTTNLIVEVFGQLGSTRSTASILGVTDRATSSLTEPGNYVFVRGNFVYDGYPLLVAPRSGSTLTSLELKTASDLMNGRDVYQSIETALTRQGNTYAGQVNSLTETIEISDSASLTAKYNLSGSLSITTATSTSYALTTPDVTSLELWYTVDGVTDTVTLTPASKIRATALDLSDPEQIIRGDDVIRVNGTGAQGFSSGPGNDVLYPGRGSAEFDMGQDFDTVIFQASQSGFSISRGTDGSVVVNGNSAGWGTVTLTDVERIVFNDSTVGFDTGDSSLGQAYRIYKAAFDRDPMDGDTAGLGYWIAQIDNGMDMVEIAARFIDSEEFRSLYGQNPKNGEFLNKVYLNVLDRLPDSGGYSWWIDQLENNPEKTWQKVLADFSESPENQANVAELIANGIVFDPWTA